MDAGAPELWAMGRFGRLGDMSNLINRALKAEYRVAVITVPSDLQNVPEGEQAPRVENFPREADVVFDSCNVHFLTAPDLQIIHSAGSGVKGFRNEATLQNHRATGAGC